MPKKTTLSCSWALLLPLTGRRMHPLDSLRWRSVQEMGWPRFPGATEPGTLLGQVVLPDSVSCLGIQDKGYSHRQAKSELKSISASLIQSRRKGSSWWHLCTSPPELVASCRALHGLRKKVKVPLSQREAFLAALESLLFHALYERVCSL